MSRTRNPWIGPAARPVAIPEDIDDPSLKASDVVELPFHVRWSDPSITYDLGQRADRIRVYEQVRREDTEDDIRFYIEVGELVELFGELVLPPKVRRAWADSSANSRSQSFKNSTDCIFPDLRIRDWQPHFEARPFGESGSDDADLAAVDLDDSPNDRQA